MPRTDRADLIDLGNGDQLTDAEILIAPFERECHSLCHTGESFPRRKAEIEVKIDGTGYFHHAPFDHQHIVALVCHEARNIARTGYIAHDGTRFKVLRLDGTVDGAGHGPYQISSIYQ